MQVPVDAVTGRIDTGEQRASGVDRRRSHRNGRGDRARRECRSRECRSRGGCRGCGRGHLGRGFTEQEREGRTSRRGGSGRRPRSPGRWPARRRGRRSWRRRLVPGAVRRLSWRRRLAAEAFGDELRDLRFLPEDFGLVLGVCRLPAGRRPSTWRLPPSARRHWRSSRPPPRPVGRRRRPSCQRSPGRVGRARRRPGSKGRWPSPPAGSLGRWRDRARRSLCLASYSPS